MVRILERVGRWSKPKLKISDGGVPLLVSCPVLTWLWLVKVRASIPVLFKRL